MLFTPDWGTTGERPFWRCLLHRITLEKTELPNRPISVLDNSKETMLAPELGSSLSIPHGCLYPVRVSDLDQEVLKEVMAKNRGRTLLDLNKTSEYSSVTSTNVEAFDEKKTPAVPDPLADADDHLSASLIPPVDPEELIPKHSAFLARLLMRGMDLDKSTPGGSHDHAVISMRATDGPTRQVPAAKPSSNNMPVFWYELQDLQQFLWPKAESFERQTYLDLVKRTWKKSIWSEEDDEERTLQPRGTCGILHSLCPAGSPGLGGRTAP